MSNFEGAIYGMGNPLLDICATIDQAFLDKYDLKANDQILAEEKHDELFPELLTVPGNYYIAGGATQNALRGVQRLLPPNSVFFTGSVSNDEFGAKLTQAAQADGLTVDYYIDETAPTGTCGTCISGHNRSLIAKLSAANNFQDSHLDKPEIWNRVEKARLYYIAGFFLTVSPPSIQRVAKHAAENNKIFCMNLSAPFLPQFFKDQMDAAAPYWDIIFGNETEARAYAESHALGTQDVKEIALKIAALPKVNQSRPRLVVFTQGTEPTIVVEGDKVTEYPILPLAEEEICDTNGAGDAFVGGFLSEYIRGSSIDRAVAAGHWLAGVVIRQAGPFYPPGELKFE